MWRTVKWLLARGPFRNILADVIFEAPPMQGQAEHSLLQWRLKRRIDTNRVFVSLKVVPDYYGGVEGRYRNYIEFEIEDAEQIKAGLDLCLEEHRRSALTATASPSRHNPEQP